MDSETFTEYLEKRYYNQLNYYEKSAGKNQKKYKYFQWALIILSASAPILAALDKEFGLQYIVVGVTAIVAILTTGLKTFQFQELWANYRATAEQLKPEIHYYNFNVGPYGMSGLDKEALFISRVEAILDKEHQGWPPAKKLRDDRNLGDKEKSSTSLTDISDSTAKSEK